MLLAGTLKYQRGKKEFKEKKAAALADFIFQHYTFESSASDNSAANTQQQRARFIAAFHQKLLQWKQEKEKRAHTGVMERTAETMLKEVLSELAAKRKASDSSTLSDADLVSQAVERYFEDEIANTVLFDGVEQMLDRLKAEARGFSRLRMLILCLSAHRASSLR